MIETYRLCNEIKHAIDAKRFAAAVGRTVQTVYTWCRDPRDPEADGSPNLFDWLESVIDVLAARPEGRPVLLQLRAWFLATVDRALGAWTPVALTRDSLASETSRVLREFSDLVEECGPDSFCRERLQKEGAEAIEAIERLLRAARVGMEKGETEGGRTTRRVG